MIITTHARQRLAERTGVTLELFEAILRTKAYEYIGSKDAALTVAAKADTDYYVFYDPEFDARQVFVVREGAVVTVLNEEHALMHEIRVRSRQYRRRHLRRLYAVRLLGMAPRDVVALDVVLRVYADRTTVQPILERQLLRIAKADDGAIGGMRAPEVFDVFSDAIAETLKTEEVVLGQCPRLVTEIVFKEVLSKKPIRWFTFSREVLSRLYARPGAVVEGVVEVTRHDDVHRVTFPLTWRGGFSDGYNQVLKELHGRLRTITGILAQKLSPAAAAEVRYLTQIVDTERGAVIHEATYTHQGAVYECFLRN